MSVWCASKWFSIFWLYWNICFKYIYIFLMVSWVQVAVLILVNLCPYSEIKTDEALLLPVLIQLSPPQESRNSNRAWDLSRRDSMEKKNYIHIMHHSDTTKKRTWAILTSSPLTSILISKILSGLKLSAPSSISFFYPAINSDSIDFCVHCSEGRGKSYWGSHTLTLVFRGLGTIPGEEL